MENVLFQEIISLNKEYSKKLGLENVFIIKKIFELSEKEKKITQNLIAAETEGFVVKPVTNLNELKKRGIIETVEGQLVLNLQNLQEIFSKLFLLLKFLLKYKLIWYLFSIKKVIE